MIRSWLGGSLVASLALLVLAPGCRDEECVVDFDCGDSEACRASSCVAVECLDDWDCGEGACVDDVCVECEWSFQCGHLQVCEDHVCVADPGPGPGPEPEPVCGDGWCWCETGVPGTPVCDPLGVVIGCDCEDVVACAELTFFGWDPGCFPPGPTGVHVADRLTSIWGVAPTSFCFYDSWQGTWANSACVPPQIQPLNGFYCAYDDRIIVDLALVQGVLGGFAGAAFIGHEWGHLVQARLGILGAFPTVFQQETHADCLSGVFGRAEEQQGYLAPGGAVDSFRAWCLANRPSGWFDPSSHGSCEERSAAFSYGYQGAAAYEEELCSGSALDVALVLCPL